MVFRLLDKNYRSLNAEYKSLFEIAALSHMGSVYREFSDFSHYFNQRGSVLDLQYDFFNRVNKGDKGLVSFSLYNILNDSEENIDSLRSLYKI